jgi:hypothetical protein
LGTILLAGGFFGMLMIFKLGPDITTAQVAALTEIQVGPSPLAPTGCVDFPFTIWAENVWRGMGSLEEPVPLVENCCP